ncbi:NepR family anti-sigma factor [Sulfitobacter sp. HNIBRBA3233]|uniref:NepR family anti-sigma factor n=1 Tax=Sulfitobacter marinivivus TaxID=3158558 RepID=UPI0032DEE750
MTNQGRQDRREGVIDENLRRVFDETVEEGIPDRFKDLLEQLKKQDEQQETSR